MGVAPACPRCLSSVKPPGLWSSSWQCERHGDVLPFHTAPVTSEAALLHLAAAAQVPVWVPRPLPVGWVVSGIGWAGDERSGARATAVACSGPSPVGGPGDLILVAEEPGMGLGARLAGATSVDPTCSGGSPDFKVVAAHHPTALWAQSTPPDRAAFAGEAKTVWLEMVFWPPRASLLLLEHLDISDIRDGLYADVDLVFGAPSPFLARQERTV
ncbi:MAG TPA: DUF6758 family protein [Frankiaceae bacterium]|nr:DUF6758 family protein [Frankiaceae bacterium]